MDSHQEKCPCEKNEHIQESDESVSDSSPSKEKRKISLTSLGFNLKRGHSLHFKSKKNKVCNESTSSSSTSTSPNNNNSKKSPKWGLKFNCIKKEPKVVATTEPQNCCKCTCYRRTEEHHLGAGVVFESPACEPLENSISSQGVESPVETTSTITKIQNDVPEYCSQPVQVETIENVQTNRAIYSTCNNSMIAPLPEISWYGSLKIFCYHKC